MKNMSQKNRLVEARTAFEVNLGNTEGQKKVSIRQTSWRMLIYLTNISMALKISSVWFG
jgi:hypothetical protein